ncbi:vacuolar protein sorting-associated protein 41 [Anaeramoeba flamelloides]|uniref:Vacuolar protein sorting-associated protein 41 n=1 Tax=Anaeramoeba flamelloides TaxID=1746091 RepID=A0AAV7YN29_9EUKA|nr:vacuolar protein sorting-associated protein 41 [Anaeramoeba flamelloides]
MSQTKTPISRTFGGSSDSESTISSITSSDSEQEQNQSKSELHNTSPSHSLHLHHEENEPQLSYFRIQSDFKKIASKKVITCLKCLSKFIIVGTKTGQVYIFDNEGNFSKKYKFTYKTKYPIIQIEFKNRHVVILTLSGKIIIEELGTNKREQYEHSQPITTFLLMSNFGKDTTRNFLFGDSLGKVYLSTKGLFTRTKTVISDTQGGGNIKILSINPTERIVVWADQKNLLFYDTVNNSLIKKINHPKHFSKFARIKMPLMLNWISDFELLLTWGNILVNFIIIADDRKKKQKKKPKMDQNSKEDQNLNKKEKKPTLAKLNNSNKASKKSIINLLSIQNNNDNDNTNNNNNNNNNTIANTESSKGNINTNSAFSRTELTHKTKKLRIIRKTVLTFSYVVFGLLQLQNGNYAALTLSYNLMGNYFYQELTKEKLNMLSSNDINPIMKLLSKADFKEIYSEELRLQKGSSLVETFDKYCVDSSKNGKLMLLTLGSEIILSKMISVDDRIEWLVARNQFKSALKLAREHPKIVKKINEKEISNKLLNYYLLKRDFREMIEELPNFCGNDPQLWEYWIFVFLRANELIRLVPVIPIKNPQLRSTIYEMVLSKMMLVDPKTFRQLINYWPFTIFDPQAVIQVLDKKIKNEKSVDRTLMLSLGEIYEKMDFIAQAVSTYLEAGKKDVFEMIRDSNLYNQIQDKAVLLLEADEEKGLELLIQHYKQIPIKKVVTQLEKDKYKRELLLKYLHQLSKIDLQLTHEFHKIQFDLYAEFMPSELLNFLKADTNIPLSNAIVACKRHKRHVVSVYVLWKMGKTNEALDLVMNKQSDISQAIELVQSEDDPSLWNELVKVCMQHPRHISYLLQSLVNTQIKPLDIIERIPTSRKIGNLRDSLIDTIHDQKIKTELIGVTKSLIFKDCGDLMEELHYDLTGSTFVEPSQECIICGDPIKNLAKDRCIIFFCGHTYHELCLKYTLDSDRQHQRENYNQRKQQQGRQQRRNNNSSNDNDNDNQGLSRNFGNKENFKKAIEKEREKEFQKIQREEIQEKNRLEEEEKKREESGLIASVNRAGEVKIYNGNRLNLLNFIKKDYDRKKFEKMRNKEILEKKKLEQQKARQKRTQVIKKNFVKNVVNRIPKKNNTQLRCVICSSREKEREKYKVY